MNESNLKVLVVEDIEHARKDYVAHLESKGMIVKEADNVMDALDLVGSWRPDVVVLDMSIPPGPGEKPGIYRDEGIIAANKIKEFDKNIGLVLYTNYPYYLDEVTDMIRKGYGRGLIYLFKAESSLDELSSAVRRANEGLQMISSVALEKGRERPDTVVQTLTDLERKVVNNALKYIEEQGLTDREHEVALGVSESLQDAAIAQRLGVVPGTVSGYINNVYSKLGLNEDETAMLNKRALLAKIYMIYRRRKHYEIRGDK